jgi:hypothetical protein
MAIIHLNPDIENNIYELSLDDGKSIISLFEQGNLVIIKDFRIEADFEFLSTLRPAVENATRRDKYVFTKAIRGNLESRASKWQKFFGDAPSSAIREKAKYEIERVDWQINGIVRKIFKNHEFSTEFIAWKFHRITGENLHIDNLPNSNNTAQVRLFSNVDSSPRLWSVGRHWRYYAERHYESAALREVIDNPFEFNGRLNHAAFGSSQQSCDEPRHLLSFEPGEIWLANSVLVAHQIRSGNLLCSAHYEYPYHQCMDQTTSLPHQIKMVAGLPAPTRRMFSARLRDIIGLGNFQGRV